MTNLIWRIMVAVLAAMQLRSMLPTTRCWHRYSLTCPQIIRSGWPSGSARSSAADGLQH
jgi:hypothetical protein